MKKLIKFTCVLGLFIFSFAFGQNLDYGKLHNDAVSKYYMNHNQEEQTNMQQILQQETDYLKIIDNEHFQDVNANDIIGRYTDFVRFTNKREEPTMNDLLNYLLMNKRISEKNFNFLKDNILIRTEFENKINSIDRYLESNSLSNIDTEQISMIKSILVSSHDLWNKRNPARDRNDALLIYDAIGALLWSETGPGAIIAGCAYSVFANHILP